jgi:hypothetical protein
MGAYPSAIRDCERARLASDDIDLYVNLTAAFALSGDMAKAVQTKEQLLKADPRFTIGGMEASMSGRNEKVIESVRAHVIAGLRKAGVPE